jgi:hypothetical protein
MQCFSSSNCFIVQLNCSSFHPPPAILSNLVENAPFCFFRSPTIRDLPEALFIGRCPLWCGTFKNADRLRGCSVFQCQQSRILRPPVAKFSKVWGFVPQMLGLHLRSYRQHFHKRFRTQLHDRDQTQKDGFRRTQRCCGRIVGESGTSTITVSHWFFIHFPSTTQLAERPPTASLPFFLRQLPLTLVVFCPCLFLSFTASTCNLSQASLLFLFLTSAM